MSHFIVFSKDFSRQGYITPS